MCKDEELNFDAREIGICGTSRWRCPIGYCPIQGNSGAESSRYHWIQSKGTVLRTVAVLFRAQYHSLDQKDHFSRHQGMGRNSWILCFSFPASFYPLELSLLIILICFCFNCFSGSLFTPGWNLQIPRCHTPSLCPQKTAHWTRPSSHRVQVIGNASLPSVPSDVDKQRRYKRWNPPLSFVLAQLKLSNMEPRIWIFLWDLSFLSFSKHSYTMLPTPAPPWLPVSIWGCQLPGQDHNLTNWNYGSAAEKAQAVNSDRLDFKSLCKLCDCKLLPVIVPANHVTWACYLTSLSSSFHRCKWWK